MEASRTTVLPVCSPQLLNECVTHEADAVEKLICSLPGIEDVLHFICLCCVTTPCAQHMVPRDFVQSTAAAKREYGHAVACRNCWHRPLPRDADQPPQSDIPPRSLMAYTEQLIYQALRGVVQLIKAAFNALELFGGSSQVCFPLQSCEERQDYFHFGWSQSILSDRSILRCDLEQSIRDFTPPRNCRNGARQAGSFIRALARLAQD